MRSAAYDLSQFAPLPERRIAQVRIIDNPSQKKVIRTYRARLLTLSVILFILMSLTVYNNMLIDLTRSDIGKRNQELSRLENEYSYLNCELENMISLKNATNYAENELGLVKVSPSQIEYLNLHDENTIVESDSFRESGNIFIRIYQNCLSLLSKK